ncbi:alpha-2-macroglobulin [Chitinimonas sp. BJYL2]|uniref:alpha-2-macroglobulin family protein n=1 Tax=Chitinimonas sp. BJYL2 TaxID=2976696 RepID=UPI0022B2B354|nr:MG2 domain-containing protein [Chitinimonas sp. BJYL2]
MRVFVLLLSAMLADAATIERFSPQGAVSTVRQVKVLFSEPMVNFGDPRLVDPFDADCGNQAGQGRWVDERNWVYDFVSDLPAASQCRFVLRPGTVSRSGKAVASASYAFSTGGPEPQADIRPETGEWIGEQQVFIVPFAAPPTPESLLAHARCEVDGLSERLPVVRLPDAERDSLLRGLYGSQRSQWPMHAEALRCQRTLPSDVGMRLVFDAGLAAANGLRLAEPMQFDYRVRPGFSAWIGCERQRDKGACVPISPIELRFSTPLPAAQLRGVVLTSTDGKQRWPGELMRDEDRTVSLDEQGKPMELVSGLRFKPPFAEKAALLLALPQGLRDEWGRALSNAKAFPQTVRTDSYPALAKFSADFGIVERSLPALPVTLRNVGEAARIGDPPPVLLSERLVGLASPNGQPTPKPLGLPYRQLTLTREADILDWYQRLRRGPRAGPNEDYRAAALLRDVAGTRSLRLPVPADDKAAEVIGIPLPEAGLTLVEIDSTRLGQRLLQPAAPMQIVAGALVTNLAVHFRRGFDDALVWVTTLDKGWLVNGAVVGIYDCRGKLLASGKTDKQGGWHYRQALPPERYDCPLFVFARQGADVSFVASDWREGIESWRFGINTEYDRQRRQGYHAVFDRGLYRAGETVSMKLLARERTASGFGPLAASQLPAQVRLRHQGSDDSIVLPVRWHAGSAELSWQIPSTAKLGGYAVELERQRGKQVDHLGYAGLFQVAEFRVPLMRGTLKLPLNPIASQQLPVSVQVQYLAGGPAAGEGVTLRGMVSRLGERRLEGFEQFSFSRGNVSPAVLQGEEREEETQADAALSPQTVRLDKAGAATLNLGGWARSDSALTLMAELEYRDPNGEVQTSATSTVIWPAAVQAGLHIGQRIDGRQHISAAVADLAGKPRAGHAVRVDAWSQIHDSHRKRLVGGFYSYSYQTRYVPLGEVCKGKTDARGRFGCALPATLKGSLILRASVQDEAGRTAYTHQNTWLGEDEGGWRLSDTDRIDLIADKAAYQPGETASLRIEMPFREATALIALEREGVLSWRTQRVTVANPTIRIPIQANHGPNVYVSVLLVRGRVTEPAPTALVDLGKPAYRLGIARLKVGVSAYALEVKVSSDKTLYQVRDKARVSISVKTADGRPLPAGAEVALAAVDEGLLALRPNDSWLVLDAMLGERPYGLHTATAQGMVIGKRHFGRKAVPVGGGGGKTGTRELFDTLLLWRARVALDARGQASVEVPLNDALTSFRIVAVATAGPDRFGTGQASIRASKDVMLFSGLPRTVRQGDLFDAGFTVRNTTGQTLKLSVSANVAGLPPLPPQVIELAGGAAQEISWPFSVPVAASKLDWMVTVSGSDGRRYDQLAQNQSVIEAIPVRVLQATLAQLSPDYTLPIAPPADALPGRGGLSISLSPSLAAALDGVEDYFRSYPYSCLEQQTSRMIGLNDRAGWDTVVSRLDNYLDADGFAMYFPGMRQGSPILTAHLLSLSAVSGWPLPDTGRERMKAALTGHVAGRLQARPSTGDSTSKAIYLLDAIAALARHDAARPAMLDGMVLEPNRWPTSTVLDWIAILDKLPDAPQRATRLAAARQILLARQDLGGTTLNLSGPSWDERWWLMDSTDADAAKLLIDATAQKSANAAELGRLARGLVARQQRGHWDTTVANVWGTLALRQFASQVESGAPAGKTVAAFAKETAPREQVFDWAGAAKGGQINLGWPAKAAELTLSHRGSGKPWVTVQSRAAIPLTAPLMAGYRVDKQWSRIEGSSKGYARGEVWRVRLTIDAQADMSWVAVNDPVPVGGQLLGRGFATDSALLAGGERREGYWPAFEERCETAYRAYYEWLPKGRHVLEYTLRLNNRGRFALPATRVEALYAPERFGEVPNAQIKVE